MSATICWERCGGANTLHVGAPSQFIEALKRADLFDRKLDGGDLDTLRGMRAAWLDSWNKGAAAVDEVIGDIADGHDVRIWKEER